MQPGLPVTITPTSPRTVTDSGRCLILFARAPVAGNVKTRLEPVLGRDGALVLYRWLFKRQVQLVNAYRQASRWLALEGDPAHPDCQAFDGEVVGQQGEDIGARMHQVLATALQTHTAAVLIGADCPFLDTGYIERAFAVLEGGMDAVFGPASDGGYVLVGLRRAQPALFTGIGWSTAGVMAQTRLRLETLGWSWQELPVVHDIDGPDDLSLLQHDAQGHWRL